MLARFRRRLNIEKQNPLVPQISWVCFQRVLDTEPIERPRILCSTRDSVSDSKEHDPQKAKKCDRQRKAARKNE
jgi:hypothetical protein